MGEAVLEQHPEVAEIKFSAPNKHHFLVDLSPFGVENPGEVFIAADRPYGLIEATVVRDDASRPGHRLARRTGLRVGTSNGMSPGRANFVLAAGDAVSAG